MFGKKVFAAMLATVLGASLFGANAAKAVINLDSDEGGVTYATETLAAPVMDHADYSVVNGSGTDLNVTAAIGLGGPNGTFVTVQFTLDGMVFSEAVMGTNVAISLTGHGDASLRSGGKVGDALVSFIVSRTANTSAASMITLTIGQLGVKPGVPGSVTMAVTDSVGDALTHTASYTNAVRTMRALQETADPMNLQATVDERFKSFGGVFMGTLGKFEVGANTDLLNAEDGEDVTLGDIIMTDDTSSVTISGDFSFVAAAWLDADGMCDDTVDNLVQTEDETVLDELAAQPPSAFMRDDADATPYLCISVPTGDEEADAIPRTDPYMVTTEYAAGTPMAGWPSNPGEQALGRITHDGTTVHIPFLTTWADYNQRIVISNRGTNSADYWITFRPEEGVTATPNDMYAMGTLDGNSTMVLRAMDVVTLEGRTRTAATFVAEAKSTQIDVATVIVNMMTGSTDTVNYDPEPTD